MARQKRKRALRAPQSRLVPTLRAALAVVAAALDELARKSHAPRRRRG